MDPDEKKKRQFIKVILTEVLMVLSVIAIVVVTILLAMGFSISTNGNIEQTGLMQVHSQPTGATVTLDGSALFSRTNTSRTMSAGEHHLKLSRDGYDTWEKTIKMYSGVLLRVYYPRLFLQNRVAESVLDLSTNNELKNLEFYVPSTSRNYAIYAEEDATEWRLLDLRGDEVKTTTIDVSEILPGVVEKKTDVSPASIRERQKSAKYQLEAKIEDLRWSNNDEKILVKVSYNGKVEWILVNLRNVAASLNLTKIFGLNFEQVEMIDGAASQLYVLANHRLYRVNVAGEVLSRILVDDVATFVNRGAVAIYLTQADDKTGVQTIGVYRDDEKAGTTLVELPKEAKNVKIGISRYYDEDYFAYIVDEKMTVYYGVLPSYNENRDGSALENLRSLVDARELEETPESFTVSKDGEYMVARRGVKFMVTDLDMGELFSYEAATDKLNWLDASMMFAVKDGEVQVWDFDGTNLRNLSASAKTATGQQVKVADFPVLLSANNRWLYYLVKNENSWTLTRERVQ